MEWKSSEPTLVHGAHWKRLHSGRTRRYGTNVSVNFFFLGINYGQICRHVHKGAEVLLISQEDSDHSYYWSDSTIFQYTFLPPMLNHTQTRPSCTWILCIICLMMLILLPGRVTVQDVKLPLMTLPLCLLKVITHTLVFWNTLLSSLRRYKNFILPQKISRSQ